MAFKIKKKFTDKVQDFLKVDEKTAQTILEKAIAGIECLETDESVNSWIENRLFVNIVFIDEAGYRAMCIDALKIVGSTIATDFGSSRQRDFGQLWADLTRGYLGEYATKLFFKKRFDLEIGLAHEKGKLQDFLPTDVAWIIDKNGQKREPRKNIGIKTMKWNGIWLDIPGAQFNHSNIQICVKIGAERDHLFSFFKSISVFKDKILKLGTDINSLTPKESANIYDSIPDFKPVTAYICGFTRSDDIFTNLSYKGKKGRKHYEIYAWRGAINSGDLNKIKEIENVTGEVKFRGIGKFSHDSGYLFNTGALTFNSNEWENLIKQI